MDQGNFGREFWKQFMGIYIRESLGGVGEIILGEKWIREFFRGVGQIVQWRNGLRYFRSELENQFRGETYFGNLGGVGEIILGRNGLGKFWGSWENNLGEKQFREIFELGKQIRGNFCGCFGEINQGRNRFEKEIGLGNDCVEKQFREEMSSGKLEVQLNNLGKILVREIWFQRFREWQSGEIIQGRNGFREFREEFREW